MMKVKDFEDYTIDEAGNVFSIRKNNINITSISYSANGKRKTGGGYIWHFV